MISEWFDLIKLPYLLYVLGQAGLIKQCRPRSDAATRGVRSGSTLFATHTAILHTFAGSKMDLLSSNFTQFTGSKMDLLSSNLHTFAGSKMDLLSSNFTQFTGSKMDLLSSNFTHIHR